MEAIVVKGFIVVSMVGVSDVEVPIWLGIVKDLNQLLSAIAAVERGILLAIVIRETRKGELLRR